jgi:hypothetical protein
MNLSKTGLKYEIPDTFKRQAILNCRIVASTIVYVCLDYLDSFLQGYSPGEGLSTLVEYEKALLSRQQVDPLFKSPEEQGAKNKYHKEMKDLV